MKGILTDCVTGKTQEIELEYEIIKREGREVFQLIGGVTGFESFYIHDKYTPIDKMFVTGWNACAGTKNKYDKLFIPAKEMKKAFDPCLNGGNNDKS